MLKIWTILSRMTGRSQILRSHHNTPGKYDRRLFHAVLRAGHIRTAPDYRIERQSGLGHDLLLCVAGKGMVRCDDRAHAVKAGQLVWIDCRRPHAHWPSKNDPWELVWIRIDGPQAHVIAQALEVAAKPVFSGIDALDVKQCLVAIMELLSTQSPALNATLHAHLAMVVAILFQARPIGGTGHNEGNFPANRLDVVLSHMHLEYSRPWSVDELARLAKLSTSQFYRCFRQQIGSSPIDWLRRRRISEAKRMLAETDTPIHTIAKSVGYEDPFYFSRDFKRAVGLAPRSYRYQECITPLHGET